MIFSIQAGKDTKLSSMESTARITAPPMHYLQQGKDTGRDSVYMELFGEVRYFDSDSIFFHMAHNEPGRIFEEIYFYYTDVVAHMSAEEKEGEVHKMEEAAKQYKSKRLRHELEFLRAYRYKGENYGLSLPRMRKVAERAAGWGDLLLECRALQYILSIAYDHRAYDVLFKTAGRLQEVLGRLSEEELPDIRYTYYHLGNAYYEFRDYERAIPLLWQALTDSTRMFYDRGNLRARNTLGVYYLRKNRPDSAAYYFRTMLESPDVVKFRPMYDCIALANLGHIIRQEGDPLLALQYYDAALPVAISEKDFTFAIHIYAGMSEAWMDRKDLPRAKACIDSIQACIDNYAYNRGMVRSLYPVKSRYYAEKGDAHMARALMDSTLAANQRYEEQYNALVMLRAEQELFDAERNINEAEIRRQQGFLLTACVVIVLILVFMVLLIRFYRIRQKAYRKLVEQSKQWAGADKIPTPATSQPDHEDRVVMEKVEQLMERQKLYRDPDLTLEKLAETAGVSRHVLSKAINTIRQENFFNYINDYRIREAIRLLSDPANAGMKIDTIAYDCGFANRQTFTRVFTAKTGISPSNFRNNS